MSEEQLIPSGEREEHKIKKDTIMKVLKSLTDSHVKTSYIYGIDLRVKESSYISKRLYSLHTSKLIFFEEGSVGEVLKKIFDRKNSTLAVVINETFEFFKQLVDVIGKDIVIICEGDFLEIPEELKGFKIVKSAEFMDSLEQII